MDKHKLLEKFNEVVPQTLMETLAIRYIEVDPDQGLLRASMPVNPRVHQPMGLLHGGATAALAESLGSAASMMFVDPQKVAVLGIQLSCNHLRSISEGLVFGTARILHKGRTTHLWEIEVRDESGQLISHCKLTNMLKPLKSKAHAR
jgi:uncharacterized protein (TIGR00369 family)